MNLDMDFELRRRSVEQDEPAERGTLLNFLGRGIGILSSFRRERPGKIEEGVLAGATSAVSELRQRGERVRAEELVGKMISALPKEQFPGIKSLQENDPQAIQELTNELLDVMNTNDTKERDQKSEKLIEVYEIIGENGREVRQILHIVGGLGGRVPAEGFSPEELASWQKTLEDAQSRTGGIQEGFRSGGGFILKFLLLTTMFMIFAQYKLMRLALEKGAGVKTKNRK